MISRPLPRDNVQNIEIDVIKTIGDYGDDGGESLAIFGNNTIIGGTWNQSLNHSAFVCSLGYSGELLWKKIWKNGTFGEVYTIDLDDQGNIYCAYNTDGPNAVIKFSENGTILFWKTLAVEGIWTVSYGANSIFIGGTNGTNAYVARLSLNGTILWQRDWHIGGTDTLAGSLVSNDNNTLYMVGTTIAYPPGPSDALLVAFDVDNGSELWNATWGALGASEDAVRLTSDKQGSLYITGYEDTNAYIRKYYKTGTINWEKQIPSSSGHGVLVNDTTVYVCGIYNTAKTEAMIYSYQDNGLFVENNILHGYNISYLWDLSISNDGKIYGIGGVINGTTNMDIALFSITQSLVPELTTIILPTIAVIALFIVILKRNRRAS